MAEKPENEAWATFWPPASLEEMPTAARHPLTQTGSKTGALEVLSENVSQVSDTFLRPGRTV
jgi:hypothetical protein